MKRKIGVALAALSATIALAAITVVGAKGQGHALNAAGHRAEFHMDAHKATGDGSVRTGGFFRFITRGGTAAVPVTNGIVIPEVARLTKAGRVCEFGGPSSMQIRVGTNYETVRGVCSVRVEDRKAPNATSNTPDLIRVRFVANVTNRVFEWSGAVTRGDILVYERVVQ
jgi:hypothetical protein